MTIARGASSSVLATLVVVALSLATCVAGAQALDTVLLPGGGRIRGTVEVYEPNRQVVVLLPDGSRRRLRRGEFESVIFGDAPSPPSAPTEPEPSPTPAAPEAPAPDAAAPEPAPPAPDTAPPSASPLPPPAALEPAPTPGSDAPSITPDAQQRLEGAIPAAPQPLAPAVAPAVAFGDGHADGAWPEEDPNRIPRPIGMFHVGVQLLGSLQLATAGPEYFYGGPRPESFVFGGELSGYVDLRLALPFHIRGALVIAGFGDVGGVHRIYDSSWSLNPTLVATTLHGRGVLELGGRALVGFLLTDGFAIRIGAQGGMEWLSTVAHAESYGDGVLELAVRVLDSRFEIVALTALGVRSIGYESYSAAETRMGTRSGFSARVSLGVGYVF